jgi:putative ABC transport system ATP-binding protein
MPEPFIQISNLVKTYETPAGPLNVLRGIDLELAPGDFVALVGPSGGGKTTFLNMITGVDKPTSGMVFVDSVDVANTSERKLTRWRGRTVGIVFQFFQLLPTLTVLENVMMPMHYCGTYKGQRRERAMELLELVEVPETADKYLSQISGGQQQRAAIARALANDPKLIVGDEPTGNLDTVSAGLVFALFEDLVEQGKTIIMVTHDWELAGNIPRVEEVRNRQLVAADEIDQRLVARGARR